jgi:hypothetical protein
MLCAETLRKLYRAQRKKVLQLPSTQYKREGEIFDIKTLEDFLILLLTQKVVFIFYFFVEQLKSHLNEC